jgi:DNA polymerase
MVTKVGRLSAIHAEIYNCDKCLLHQNRTRTVPGAGNPDAEIMFIGEGPGEQEDLQGLPFVGRSGQYLDELLAGIGLTRDDVFIANVVKCRPLRNRDPFPNEIETCNPYLTAQIEIIDPLVIATLGRISMNVFLPDEKSISRVHGQPKYGTKRAYYPIYHPAYALRNANSKTDMERDFARLPAVLAEVKRRRASGEMGEEALERKIIQMPAQDFPAKQDPDDDKPTQMGLFD